MSTPAFFPKFRAFDHSTGAPLASGMLETYYAGTSTPAPTYTDATLTTANANPVILDANGEADVFVGTTVYKFILKNSAGTVQWTEDNLSYGGSAQSISGNNALINSNFRFWQAGTSFLCPAALPVGAADGWTVESNFINDVTFSRQATGLVGSTFCMRAQRNAASVNADSIYVAQALESTDSLQFQGQGITLSFWARAGANFSAAGGSLSVAIVFGGGTDESLTNIGLFPTSVGSIATGKVLTTSWQYFTFSSSSGFSAATQIAAEFFYAATGTAGANDYFEITQVQLETSAFATPYSFGVYSAEERKVQRRYYKTFPQATVPAQNAGLVGAYRFGQYVGAAIANQMLALPEPPWMRDVAGTITTYNPSVANAQARNTTVAADCSATTPLSDAAPQASMTYTTAAGSAAGNANAVHYTIDKRL